MTSTCTAHHRISIESEIFAKHLHATATTTTTLVSEVATSKVRKPWTSLFVRGRGSQVMLSNCRTFKCILCTCKGRMATSWSFSRGDRGKALFLQLPRRLTSSCGQLMLTSFTFAALSVKTRMTGALIIVRQLCTFAKVLARVWSTFTLDCKQTIRKQYMIIILADVGIKKERALRWAVPYLDHWSYGAILSRIFFFFSKCHFYM